MKVIGRVRYIGDYYDRILFFKDEEYDLLAFERGPFEDGGYRVYSPYVEDDYLFAKSEFEIVELYDDEMERA